MLSRNRVYTDGEVDPVTVNTPSTQCSANFCVHYREPGLSESATAAQVQTTLDTLEHVRTFETQTLGYRQPVSDAPAVATTDNPDGKFDVFLGDIDQEGLYGYCAPDGAEPNTEDGRAPAFCVLDNDYAQSQYGIPPLNSLRVTAAHEFFHAIQFAYDVDEDLWFMEGSATWVEDEVYDSINDNYQFLVDSPIRYPRRSADYSVDLAPYGSFVFFRFTAERLGNRNIVRQFWEYADATREPLLAPGDPRRDRRPADELDEPLHAVRQLEHAPRRQLQRARGLPDPGADAEQDPVPQRDLDRLANASTCRTCRSSTIRIAPSSSLSTRKKVLIQINGPNTSHGTNALIQRRYRNGTVTHSMIPLSSYGNASLLRDFNRASISSMYLVVSNTSTAMKDCGEGLLPYGEPRYSCSGRGIYDSARPSRSAPRCGRDGEHASESRHQGTIAGSGVVMRGNHRDPRRTPRADTERLHREHHHR